MNVLSDLDIKDILKKARIPINGIFTKDSLPKLEHGFYVINLDNSDGKGTHWTALYKYNNDLIFYYDSFGFAAPEAIEDQIKFYSMNNKQIQNINTSSCGYYVIAFIKFMHKMTNPVKAFEIFLDLFKANTEENEAILYNYLYK